MAKKSTKTTRKKTARHKPAADLSRPLVYEYFDGKGKRFGDAAKLLQRITYAPSDVPLFNGDFWARVESREASASQAAAATIADVFGLTPWNDADGTGLTEDQIIRVFGDFTLFLADEKKNPLGSSIWPRALWAQIFPQSMPAGPGSIPSCTASDLPAGNGCQPLKSSPECSDAPHRSNGTLTHTDQPKAPPDTTPPARLSPQFNPVPI